jgi:hypothetical protein
MAWQLFGLVFKKMGNVLEYFKNVSNCLNYNIYFYLSDDKSSNLYLCVLYFFNTSVD